MRAVGSFLLTYELHCLQLCLGPFFAHICCLLVYIGSFVNTLSIQVFYLQLKHVYFQLKVLVHNWNVHQKEMLPNNLNRDMFKPFRSHRRLLG